MSQSQREAVVAEARSWLRTPYHHLARVKGAGVDCAQLPLAVYEAAGVIPHQEAAYAPQWHMHHEEELYVAFVERFAVEIAEAQVQPGDFAIWKFGKTFSHGAIVIDPPRVIHAWLGYGVTEDAYDQHEDLRKRPRRFFTIQGM
jgi:NlpC/P60 family putative phage cell wall peptidase